MLFEFLKDLIISILQMLRDVQFEGISLLTIILSMAIFSLLVDFIQGLYD